MSDFSQNGIISSLHDFGTKSTKDIETDQSNIKSLLKKNSDGEIISSNDESTSIESSILKKIK